MAPARHCGTCGARLDEQGICPGCPPSRRKPVAATAVGLGPSPAPAKNERGVVDTQPGYRSTPPPAPVAGGSLPSSPPTHASSAPTRRDEVPTVPGHRNASRGPAPPPSAPRGARGAPAPLTAVAGEAFTVTRAFNAAFRKPIDGWTVELAEPVGPSTAGGAQALQHIALISPGGQRMAVGSVDPARHTAKLRSHTLVDQVHRRRFGAPFPVAEDAYATFQDLASRLLSGSSYVVTIETAGDAPVARRDASVWPWVLLGVLVLLLLLAAAVFLRIIRG